MHAIAIDAIVSHTLFFYSKDGRPQPNVDIYWQINPNTLHYSTNADKSIAARIKTDITLVSETGKVTNDQFILQTVPRASLNDIMKYPIIELRNYVLPEGQVKIRLRLTDVEDTTNNFSYSDSLTIPSSPSTPYYSGIQLADTIIEMPKQSIFTRNGKQIIPFCTNFYDDGVNRMFYYTELYNTDKIAPSAYPLVQTMAISRGENDGYFGKLLRTDTITSPQAMRAASGSFDLSPLPSGNYYIRVSVANNRKEQLTANALFFQKLNKHPYVPPVDTTKKAIVNDTGLESVNVLNLSKTFVAKYDLAQIKAILKMLLPFSDKVGKQSIYNFLKKPEEIYMRYYIYNYFANINKKDPGKAWKDFSAKITEVNKKFNTHSIPGYETERGIIYLRYGPPTDIITVENEQGSRPYEIWQYNTVTEQNGNSRADVVFLFYKPDEMIDDFRLLHSNVFGEVQNQQWRLTLYNNTATGVFTNETRAEQYIGNK